ncbi:endonuclease III [Candidatus Roizmanbacteria bacterium RIFCSPHIGHO2_02_FULL_40_13b]|uniref:Endonuclease III n=1 Tax=Candidatus Roizmanbacteria bacterium RIFCSPHIGHO2_01_FULL_39_24 TaxID=1802032 RepID=A0A1F7GFM4_9BACT|nr:MAG: endonuclease III [Candidatus Roizmanbacteria bacterium RIFCSPHIGHO2_01_FULL_39_24]OGK26431.1 MAG: endonuclease III [Candidatus Roizmanbacteria bacterium RIFCSPHIGHO2_02_FULL_40_13b]OGK49043.1 MAG: endonuclease III [Candidatus Roizmanbacteria bacterium RIFCSPLOWO2_01_FULL_40_32]
MKKQETAIELEARKKRAHIVNKELTKIFPTPHVELKYSSVWELLVAVVLSAQCTDKRVNIVTADLFKKYPKLEDYCNATQEEFEKDIHSTGFYRNKAKNILAAAKMVRDTFGAVVPKTMNELLTLPGVARKTANVILNDGYNIQEGIIVDTHVIRLSNKFGLTDEKDPVKIEKDLMAIVPKSEWKYFAHRLVHYGRKISPAHKVKDSTDSVSEAIKR